MARDPRLAAQVPLRDRIGGRGRGSVDRRPYHAGVEAGEHEIAAILALADWRRRIAELYAEVRRVAAVDPAAAWATWRTERESLFRLHPSSPVPAPQRESFRASHWPYDPRWRLTALLEPPAPEDDSSADDVPADDAPATMPQAIRLAIPASTGAPPPMEVIGSVSVSTRDGEHALPVFRLIEYSTGLFLPFRDATNGTETYGAGRYLLDTAKSADLGGDPAEGTLILDFNFAYHPSCAFDPAWSCPLAPPASRLDTAVEAGERLR